MFTSEDKKFLTENFAAKADVEELKVESSLLQQTVQRLEQRMDENIDLSKKVLTLVEGLAGKFADLDQENKMGAITPHRHDIQIHELVAAASTTLSK